MTPKVLVVSALPEEQQGLRQKYGVRHWRLASISTAVWLGVTGDGAEAAGRSLRIWLDEIMPTHVVVIGLGGALSPDLTPGTLIEGREVEDAEGAHALVPWFSSHSMALSAKMFSAPQIVGSTAEKARLWKAMGKPELTSVDLESSAYARTAYDAGVKLSVLRVISDGADEDLPDEITSSVGKDGSVLRWQVAMRAAINPGVWPRLMSLRSRLKLASERLALAVENGALWQRL